MRSRNFPVEQCFGLSLSLSLAGCRVEAPGKSDLAGGAANTPPTAPTVAVSPNPATTGDDLSVVVVGEAFDPDSDAVVYRYVWFANGVLQADLTGDTVPSSLTSRGEVWSVNVVATDGVGDGGVGVAEVEIINTAPTAAVTLPSAAPSSADLVAEVDLQDADGDTVFATYSWSADGVVTSWVDATVPAGAISRGQMWTVTVTPHDDEGAGEPAVASVRVENGAPVVETLDLGPSPVFTDSTLTASASAVDADGDATELSYVWTVNGLPLSVAGPTLNGATHFDKGDVVRVTVAASDLEGPGPSRASADVVVENSPPTAPVVGIRPATPIVGEALSCALLTAATDADGDPIQYSFAWEVDGVGYTGAVDGVYVGDAVPAGETLGGEQWRCVVESSDGTANAGPAEDTVTIGGDCGDGSVTLSESGVDFVTICAGSFDMGCTPGQSDCFSNESPVRAVTLSRDYYLGRTEVTQAQFMALMGYEGSYNVTCGSDCPAERVDWHEAAMFTNAMSAAAGLGECYTCGVSGGWPFCTPVGSAYDCEGYRLPTEAEWEGAARCGQDLLYAGDTMYSHVGWTWYNSYATAPVASLAPNLCGLYDMSGNVAEWTADLFGSYPSSDEVDPVGSTLGGTLGVVRGGSWGHTPVGSRVSWRGEKYWSVNDQYHGFRVARTRR
jgi:formylglycine-generating enzyme required for sulfatase activity